MRASLRALVPLAVLAAAIGLIVWLRRSAEIPESSAGPPPRPQQPPPAALPQPVQPQPAVTNRPATPAPAPAAGRSAPVMAAYVNALGPRSLGHLFIPDLPATLAALQSTPLFALLRQQPVAKVFADDAMSADALKVRGAFSELAAAVAGADAGCLLCVNLPARVAPAIVLPEAAAARLLPWLAKWLPAVGWQQRDVGRGLSVLAGVETADVLPAASAYEKRVPAGPQVLVRAERALLQYLAALLAGQAGRYLDYYARGVRLLEGSIQFSPADQMAGLPDRLVERWRCQFEAPGTWPLHDFGGPLIDTASLGRLPVTSIAAAAGFAETAGLLPALEKRASQYAPGIDLGPLLAAGLDGPAAVGLASPPATWQPMWYATLAPRGGENALPALASKFEEFCQLAGLESAEIAVEGVSVHYATTRQAGKMPLALLVPAWAVKDGKLIIGQGALGIKEMLAAQTLDTSDAYQQFAPDAPAISGIVFLDLQRAIRLAYEPYGYRFANWLKATHGVGVVMDALPTSRALADAVCPVMAWSISRADAIEFEARGPVPAALLLLLGTWLLE